MNWHIWRALDLVFPRFSEQRQYPQHLDLGVSCWEPPPLDPQFAAILPEVSFDNERVGSQFYVDGKWLFKWPVTPSEKMNSTFIRILLLRLTYKTFSSFMNSVNSDCKVNLVLHCRDLSILGNANLVNLRLLLVSSTECYSTNQSGLPFECLIYQHTNIHSRKLRRNV